MRRRRHGPPLLNSPKALICPRGSTSLPFATRWMENPLIWTSHHVDQAVDW
jgi:hypothetical protein